MIPFAAYVEKRNSSRVNSRYHTGSLSSGFLGCAAKRKDAFEFAHDTADVRRETVEVFDTMAKPGAPELWRFEPDHRTVVTVRCRPKDVVEPAYVKAEDEVRKKIAVLREQEAREVAPVMATHENPGLILPWDQK